MRRKHDSGLVQRNKQQVYPTDQFTRMMISNLGERRKHLIVCQSKEGIWSPLNRGFFEIGHSPKLRCNIFKFSKYISQND